MKNRLLVETLIIFIMFNIYFLNTSCSSQPKIYDVSKVVADQLKYKGAIGVTGKVISTHANGIFILGSSGGAMLTVRYAGDQPIANSKIIAYGEIKRDNGETFLQAKEWKQISEPVPIRRT